MPVAEFVSGPMHTEVLFRSGDPRRLALLEGPLGSYDLRYLLAHGEDTTVWKQDGRLTTRGTDSDRDAEALVSGTTVQTHLMAKLAFGRRFMSRLARQMHLESGFFSIFASRDANTATHFDRNHNFTIQLSGEKTWTVHVGRPAIEAPSDNTAFDSDRLAARLPQMHGVVIHDPCDRPRTYQMSPGAMLYVPPGYWHATECDGVSISLNLSVEPRAWFQVIGSALMRHLETQREWRSPIGVPTEVEVLAYFARLRKIVDILSAEDVGATRMSATVDDDVPLRRTLGSLLMWEKNSAGLHFGVDELRFLARGTRDEWIDILKNDMEPLLMVLAKIDTPKTVRELVAELRLDSVQIRDFVHRLVDLGYLTPVMNR